MKDAKAPRIVNTSSAFHYGGTLDFAFVLAHFRSPNFQTVLTDALTPPFHSNFNSEKDQGEQTLKPYADFYCDSKLKLAMWSRELQARCSRSEDYKHVLTYALHPGVSFENEITVKVQALIFSRPPLAVRRLQRLELGLESRDGANQNLCRQSRFAKTRHQHRARRTCDPLRCFAGRAGFGEGVHWEQEGDPGEVHGEHWWKVLHEASGGAAEAGGV